MVDDLSRHIYEKIKDLRIVKNQNGDIIEAPILIGENSYNEKIKNSYDANNNLVQLDTGNFLQCSTTGQKTCVNGDKLYILNNLQLTYEYQYFDVYVWLDGNIADNGADGAYIKATVSAETEEFSADLD